MTDEQERAVVFEQKVFEDFEGFNIEVVGGLVEDEQVGGLGEETREEQPVALAAREGADGRAGTFTREKKIFEITHEIARASIDSDGVASLTDVIENGFRLIELRAELIEIRHLHIRAVTDDFTFTSKLVDGKFPDYQRVLPRSPDKILLGSRQELRQAFTRTAILSNEKYRGVRLKLTKNTLNIVANNPEQEEAEETVSVEYSGDALEIGFNVSYLLDVLAVLSGDQVKLSLADSNSSALLEESEAGDSLYVVMPMRL